MNTRKLIKWLELVLVSIIMAFVIPVLFNWLRSGSLHVSDSGIANALFFGILIPVLLLLTKTIKNDYFFILIALVLIFALAIFGRIAFHF